MLRHKLNPIVIVLNNGGYGTERPFKTGLKPTLLPGIITDSRRFLAAGADFWWKRKANWKKRWDWRNRKRTLFALLDVHLDR